ncbi:unnamed protein product, partial [Darwinula stevensoni]
TTPPVDTFTSLVHPDWERAGLKKVKTSLPHYFPRMPADKIEAWKMFSLDTLELVKFSSPEAIIGSVGSRRQGACSGTEDLQPGMLAAVYTYDEVSRPWLGEVQAIEDGDTVKIHWYMGGYPKSWKPMSGTNSTSSVHSESLLLWGFTLTEKSQQLTSETAAELKWLYQETDNRMTIQQDRISEEV